MKYDPDFDLTFVFRKFREDGWMVSLEDEEDSWWVKARGVGALTKGRMITMKEPKRGEYDSAWCILHRLHGALGMKMKGDIMTEKIRKKKGWS